MVNSMCYAILRLVTEKASNVAPVIYRRPNVCVCTPVWSTNYIKLAKLIHKPSHLYIVFYSIRCISTLSNVCEVCDVMVT